MTASIITSGVSSERRTEVTRPTLTPRNEIGEPSAKLRSRLADVVCLPYPGEAVYWLEPGRFEQHFRGQHGGLTAAEMEIPLVALVSD